MNDKVETITIKGADGQPLRINAADFDISKHELWTDDGKQEPAKTEGGDQTGQNGGGANPPPAAPPAGAPAPKGATK